MNGAMPMFDLDAAGALVLDWLWQAVVYGSLLAGLTALLLRPVRRRLHPTTVAVLWSIVLIKFLVPIGPRAPFSLATGIDSLSRAVAPTVSVTEPDLTSLAARPSVADPGTSGAARIAFPTRWSTLLAGAYIAAAAALFVYRLRSYHALRARCEALPPAGETTQTLVERTCRRLGAARTPVAHVDEAAAGPFVIGLLRPLLVLPPRQLVRPDELETVVVHEVIHLRRGDMLVRYLQWIAGTLLFFWPVVAWVNRRIDLAREYACDEWALSHGRLTPGEYARCLLSVVRTPPAPRLAYHPACMAGHFLDLERRIDVILESKGRTVRRPVLGLLSMGLLLAWSGFTLTGAARAQDPQWGNTKEDVTKHAEYVLQHINKHAAADLDGDGSVSEKEGYVFVTAAAWEAREKVLAQYPQADLDQNGELTLYEAYALVRGVSLMPPDQVRVKVKYEAAHDKGDEKQMKELEKEHQATRMAQWHKVLDMRLWVLDQMSQEPQAGVIKKIAASQPKFDQKLEESKKEATPKAGKISAEEKAKKIEALKQKIAELEADGQTEKAAELKQKLEQLQAS